MKVGELTIKWLYPKTKHLVKDIIEYGITDNKTICRIEKDDPQFSFGYIGYGECWCSKKDQFDKNKARKLSLLRALQNANIPKEERKSIWEAYRTMTLKPRW